MSTEMNSFILLPPTLLIGALDRQAKNNRGDPQLIFEELPRLNGARCAQASPQSLTHEPLAAGIRVRGGSAPSMARRPGRAGSTGRRSVPAHSEALESARDATPASGAARSASSRLTITWTNAT
jgi:hypothetical protein